MKQLHLNPLILLIFWKKKDVDILILYSSSKSYQRS